MKVKTDCWFVSGFPGDTALWAEGRRVQCGAHVPGCWDGTTLLSALPLPTGALCLSGVCVRLGSSPNC